MERVHNLILGAGNQAVKHGLEGLAAQLIVLLHLLGFQTGFFQVSADAVLEHPKLANCVGNADAISQGFLFQNRCEHGFVQRVKGDPAFGKLP